MDPFTAAAAAPAPVPAAAALQPGVFVTSRRVALLVVLLIVGVVGFIRLWLISSFGTSVPFWDQWGAEGGALFIPLLQGSYDWNHLWTAHNEHRIALSRLLAMGLFWLNDGQWDSRVESMANSSIYAFTIGLLAWYIVRRLRWSLALPLCLLLVLVAVLPYGWENTLSGFQSGFHFLYLFTLLLLWVVAHRPATLGTAALLIVLSVLLQFSIAGGLLSLALGLFVLGLRAIGGRDSLARLALLATPLLVALVIAVATFPHLPGTELKAIGAREFFEAFMLVASWPSFAPMVLLFLLPFLGFLQRTLRERRYDPVDAFFAGVYLWCIAWAAATAYSRGHGLVAVTPRYTEALALAGIGAVYFALTLRGRVSLPRPLLSLVALAVPVAFVAGLVLQTREQWPQMQERALTTQIGAGNVRAFIEGARDVLLNQHGPYILFPTPAPLAGALSDAPTRAILPLSLRQPGVPIPRDLPAHCRWRPLPVAAVPVRGEVVCAGGGALAPGEIALGPLSRYSYALWKALRSPPLVMQLSPPRRIDPTARCSLDLVNLFFRTGAGQKVVLPYMPAVRLIGWSAQPGEAPLGPVIVSLVSARGETYSLPAVAVQNRPDVAQLLNDPAQAPSGFDTHASTAGLPEGEYRVLLGRSPATACDSQSVLVVGKSSDERLLY